MTRDAENTLKMLTIPRLDFGGNEKSECGKENYSKVRRQHFGDRRREPVK